ncbi:MAG TPA: acetyl-CoA C-acyltransferase, partial [Deferrimonas sp.]
MKSAYILAAYRTPGCRAKKGKFKDMRPDDLAAAAIRGLVERTGIDGGEVEDVIIGCAFPEGEQGMNFARVAVMKAGLPYQVPAQTVNRFCSSGLQTIAMAAERIMA